MESPLIRMRTAILSAFLLAVPLACTPAPSAPAGPAGAAAPPRDPPPPAAAPGWSLGREDGSAAEFLPYSSREFADNRAVAALPGYDRAQRTVTYRVAPLAAGAPIPFPGGFSSPCAGSAGTVGTIAIEWEEAEPGWRRLEGRLLDAGLWDYSRLSFLTSTTIDPDDLDLAQYTLRLALPDGGVVHQRLPGDVPGWERAHGPLRIDAPFQVRRGANRLVLAETSGATYGRCWRFDALRVVPAAPATRAAVLELAPASGFRHRTIYERGEAAALAATAYNLDAPARLRVAFLDVWDQAVSAQELDLVPDATGRASVPVPCPRDRSGHFRARASLTVAGARQPLQGGGGEVELRLAAIRSIAPLDEAETAASPIGLCGLVNGDAFFDPATLEPELAARRADYRAVRRLLQIRHERLHWLPWCYLEPREGEYRWEHWDRLLAQEAAEGMRVELDLMGTPAWLVRRHHPERAAAATVFEWMFSCPPEPEPWARLCGAVAERYRDRVAAIELWNEPSPQSLFWFKADADDYARLVEGGSAAIRAAAPGLPVVAQSVWARQPEFVERLHDLGIQRWVDHPADHYPDDARLRLTNAVLDRRQARNRGLVVNEAWLADPGGAGEVDQAARLRGARALVRNLAHAQAAQVERVYEFELLGRTWRKWGKIGPDGTPRAAFSALKTMVNRLAGARFLEQIDLGDGAEGYLYAYASGLRREENGGEHLLVLAPRSPGALRLPVAPAGAVVVDIMDNARTAAADGGELALELGADPLLVVGVDARRLRQRSACRIETALEYPAGGRLLALRAVLAPGAAASAATVRSASPILAAPLALALAGGAPAEVRVALRDGLPDGLHPLDLVIDLATPEGPVRVEQRREVVVAALPLGADLLPADGLRRGSRTWTAWGPGDSDWSEEDGAALAVRRWSGTGTGGLSLARPLPLIPGQRYLLAARARGAGALLVMRRDRFADGRTDERFGLRRLDLGAEWRPIAVDWTAPPGVQDATLAFYQHAGAGDFAIADARIVRIAAGVPASRFIYAASARAGGLPDPGSPGWTVIGPEGLRIPAWRGRDDLSARFAAAWEPGLLRLRVLVRDDHAAAAAAVDRLWSADGVQVALAADPAARGREGTQFAIGLLDGRPRIYRHAASATADLHAGFAVGADPAGCSAAITATPEGVLYDIAIAADAILPGLRLEPGRQLAFSLLVNDDDGEGRRGWLEWSGGIGDGADAGRFGSLRCE